MTLNGTRALTGVGQIWFRGRNAVAEIANGAEHDLASGCDERPTESGEFPPQNQF
jgi:hypothetical protein